MGMRPLSTTPQGVAPEELAAELPRLQRLALPLVHGDVHAADDLVQDAWLSSLREGRPTLSPSGWFGLLRSIAFRSRRAEARRRRRERVAVNAKAGVTSEETGELVARTALLRELSDALLELDEPYRSTLLLRYLEELSVPAIARRMATPIATVRTRLSRGLELLRDRLGRDADSRSRWLAGLPLLLQDVPSPVTWTLGASMATKTTITVSVLTTLGIGFAAWHWMNEEPKPGTARPETRFESVQLPPSATDSPDRSAVELAGGETNRSAVNKAPLVVETPAAENPVVPADAELTAPSTARLSGLLVVPPGWDFGDFELRATSGGTRRVVQGSLPANLASSHTFPFSFDELPVGPVFLHLDAVNHYFGIELPASGKSDALVELPLPVDVSLTVRDAYTGGVVHGGEVSWNAETPRGLSRYRNNIVARSGQEPFRFRAPTGKISVFFDHPEYWSEQLELSLAPGKNNVTLETMPSSGIILSFVDDAGGEVRARVPWDALDGPGSLISQSVVDGRPEATRLSVSEPGTYRFSLPDIEGFEPLEPYEIHLGPAEFVEHVVRLQRR